VAIKDFISFEDDDTTESGALYEILREVKALYSHTKSNDEIMCMAVELYFRQRFVAKPNKPKKAE
jgi:hypothetical protein